MRLIDRVRAALAPSSVDRADFHQKTRTVFSFPDWLRPRTGWRLSDRYQDTVNEGYRLNSLIYAPVRYKARAIASVPLAAATGNLDSPTWLPDDDPLARLVRRPNRWQTWRAFNEQRKTYLELAGNAFVYVERGRSGEALSLHNLRPDRVRILAGASGVQGYYYVPPGATADQGVPLLPEDVAHTKYPNPLDDLEGLGYGLPPLLAAARDADTDNAITAFIKMVFERGAMPLGMLRFNTELTETAADDARRRFMERYGGADRWFDPVVMDQGGGYERIGMTFEELGFDVLDARNEARILSVFGVPPILLGTRYGIAHGTYSNYEEARRQFWQDVLVPELRMLEDDDRRLLTRADGATVLYDLSVVPALQADTPALVEAAHRLMQMGVPTNRALAAVGLTVEAVDDGTPSGERASGGQNV
ncbi:MAG: phage portal protein [Chloroflexi bacterium]|nr:phage portal protein [Chloroflexota bacterium]